MNKILEVRWHGRGGQGAWTTSELLARSAILEEKYIQSFPEFGPERMGAPVTSFTRISEEPIRMHCSVYTPDVVAVLDPTLLKAVDVTSGLKNTGSIVINTKESPSQMRRTLNTSVGSLWTVPATEIAIKILGRPITNTAMLGAVTRVTGIVSLDSLGKVVKGRFNENLAERNIAIISEAYKGVKSE